MNEQDEKLVRQSKWSGRRVVLLYWFSIVFMGSAAAVGLGATVLNPRYTIEQDPHSGITEPWTHEDCSPCHDDIIAAWEDTKHSYVLETFTNATGTYINHTTSGDQYEYQQWLEDGGCCHKTRWTNDTSVIPSGNVTIWALNIDCAACHIEPGAPYNSSAYTPTMVKAPPPTYKPTCAGGCHIPGARGSSWWQTGHAQSLADLLATGLTDDACLHCMTGQSLYMTDTELYAYNDSFRTAIDCVTCHDPHNTDGYNEHDLRIGSTTELCGTCHIKTYEQITADTFPMNNTVTDDMSCTDCHGYEWVPAHNQSSGYPPTYTWVNGSFSDLQHNWVTPDDADDCGRCHGDENTTRWATMKEAQEQVGFLLATCQAYFPVVLAMAAEAKATVGVDETKVTNVYSLIEEAELLMLYVESDPSNGFHNPTLAEEKLNLALAKLEAAHAAAVDAINTAVTATTTTGQPTTTQPTTSEEPTTGPTPGFEWIGILFVFGILGTITSLFRKKRR